MLLHQYYGPRWLLFSILIARSFLIHSATHETPGCYEGQYSRGILSSMCVSLVMQNMCWHQWWLQQGNHNIQWSFASFGDNFLFLETQPLEQLKYSFLVLCYRMCWMYVFSLFFNLLFLISSQIKSYLEESKTNP